MYPKYATVGILFACLALVGLGLYITKQNELGAADDYTPLVQPTGVTHTIVLTEDGYQPNELTIALGDEVMFQSERDEFFWPASNVHPTHTIYSAFDPTRAISPDETWSFVFDRAGEWRYHDHISPYFTGVITVTEE